MCFLFIIPASSLLLPAQLLLEQPFVLSSLTRAVPRLISTHIPLPSQSRVPHPPSFFFHNPPSPRNPNQHQDKKKKSTKTAAPCSRLRFTPRQIFQFRSQKLAATESQQHFSSSSNPRPITKSHPHMADRSIDTNTLRDRERERKREILRLRFPHHKEHFSELLLRMIRKIKSCASTQGYKEI